MFYSSFFCQSSTQSENLIHNVEKAKKAAEILSSSADFDVEYSARNLTITDQNGKPVHFPMEEKKNLVQGSNARLVVRLK